LARSSASGEGCASNQASRISSSSAGEVVRRESASTLASFHWRAPAAVAASAHSAARTPRTLLAAIEAPVPVQQHTTACSARPSATSRAAGLGGPRPVVALGVGERAVGHRLVAARAEALDDGVRDPVRSSAATAILMSPKVSSPAWSRNVPWSRSCSRWERGWRPAMPTPSRNPFKLADEKAMELASQDGELKAALFRFVDVVPACRSLDDLARHLTGFLGEVEAPTPPISAAMRMGNNRAGRAALGAAAAAGVKHMAHRFIVGESPKAALGRCATCGATGSRRRSTCSARRPSRRPRAQRYAERCDGALATLAEAARGWPERSALERDSAGALPRANLSVKVSALTPLLRPDAPERGKRDAADRLRTLLRRARELGAHLHIDMESLDSRDAVLELVLELLAEDEFRSGPSAGMVLQAYLRDSPQTLDTIVEWTGAAPARARR
jgi:hypothetical protein